jgi:hypothetical protein
MHRAILCLPLALLLAACAGKPTTYLTLSGVPAHDRSAIAGGPPLAVSHIQIPPSIDRTQLTTATGPGSLHVAGKVSWAGPLAGMIQIVLARDLAARLPDMTVLMPGDPVPPGGVREVRVTIQNFMPDQSGAVSLDADWSVMAADGQAILRHGRFHDALPGAPQPGAEAGTMSTAIARLADVIAHGL